MIYDKLVARVVNEVRGGLRGYHNNMSMSEEQIADELVLERLAVIKEYQLKGILPVNDLMLSINCIPIDCKNIERCKCKSEFGTPTMHFEIPQIITDYGASAIAYVGSIDRQNPFLFYTATAMWNLYHKYRRRGKDKPFVYVDITPNENQMYDCFVFNAPFMKQISITAMFKDVRLLEYYRHLGCCGLIENENFNFIDNEVVDRIVKRKILYYRQLAAATLPNTQEVQPG